MKQHTPFLMIVIACCLAMSTAALGQRPEPALQPAVEIEALEVVGEAKPGEVFEVHLRYSSNINAVAMGSLTVPKHVKIAESQSEAARRVTTEEN